jgi:hypothetical protein
VEEYHQVACFSAEPPIDILRNKTCSFNTQTKHRHCKRTNTTNDVYQFFQIGLENISYVFSPCSSRTLSQGHRLWSLGTTEKSHRHLIFGVGDELVRISNVSLRSRVKEGWSLQVSSRCLTVLYVGKDMKAHVRRTMSVYAKITHIWMLHVNCN